METRDLMYPSRGALLTGPRSSPSDGLRSADMSASGSESCKQSMLVVDNPNTSLEAWDLSV